MAYITKEEVKEKAFKLKELAKKYGVKLTVSGSNSSVIKVNIASGNIDFISNYVLLTGRSVSHIDVNHYYLSNHFSGVALEFLEGVKSILQENYYDNSDIQSDYVDVAWFMHISIGKWNKPYILV